MAKFTHTIMPHSLAKALIEAGVHHFDGGGVIGDIGGAIQGIAGDFTAQNGYQAQLAPTQQTDYSGLIKASGDQTQNIQGQQQSLANTLLAQSQGQGPNPAQQALTQATNANNQRATGMIASQKGVNPAMAARIAAQNAASSNQTAAGQSALMGAQQQLGATGALAQQQATMGGQNLQALQAASGAQNAQNSTNVNNYGMAQGINSQVAQNNANAVNKTNGGILGGIGSAVGAIGGLFGLAKGGEVPDRFGKMAKLYHPQRFADGGSINTPYVPNFNNISALTDPASYGGGKKPANPAAAADAGTTSATSGYGVGSEAVAGGPMDALGGGALADLGPLALLAASGGPIPGKGAVKGNSYKNDTVPALLSPKEIVLPRSVTQAPDAPQKAAEFVRHLQEQRAGKDAEPGYGNVAASKGRLNKRAGKSEKRAA